MNFSANRVGRGPGGFTLVELLVVIVIIGVMTTLVILPTFSTGSDITRIKTATRGVMQMSRYARTMAILYQTPMALTISADGSLRVERASGGPVAPAPADTPAKADASDGGAAEPASPEGAPSAEGGGASYVMAEVNAEKTYEQVVFSVSLDLDALSEDETDAALEEGEKEKRGEAGDDEVAKTVRIPYEANGRCLPYTVKVRAAGTEEDVADALTVKVDRFGVAKVLDEDE